MRKKLLVPVFYRPAVWRSAVGVDRNDNVGLTLEAGCGEVIRLKLSAGEAINVMAALHEVLDPYLISLHSVRSEGMGDPVNESQSG